MAILDNRSPAHLSTGVEPGGRVEYTAHASLGQVMTPAAAAPYGASIVVHFPSLGDVNVMAGGVITADAISKGWEVGYTLAPGTGAASILVWWAKPGIGGEGAAPGGGFAALSNFGSGVGTATGIRFVGADCFDSNTGSGDALASGPFFSTSDFTAIPIFITTLTLPNPIRGRRYSRPIVASGGTTTGFAWTLESGALPPGLTLSATGTPSTTLSGTPTTAGTYTFTIRVTDDAANTDTQDYTITIGTVTGTDTLRGGALEQISSALVTGAGANLNAYVSLVRHAGDDRTTSTILAALTPRAWSTTLAGTGSADLHSSGLQLFSGATSTSSTLASPNTACVQGDATVTVTPQILPASPAFLGLEWTDGTTISRLAIRTSSISFESQLASTITSYASLPFASGDRVLHRAFTLRLVRLAEYVSAFVDGVFLGTLPILDAYTDGVCRIAANNLSVSADVRGEFANFDVKPAIMVDGRLANIASIEGSIVSFAAPSALDPSRLGQRDIRLGTASGYAEDGIGFLYTSTTGLFLTHQQVRKSSVVALRTRALKGSS